MDDRLLKTFYKIRIKYLERKDGAPYGNDNAKGPHKKHSRNIGSEERKKICKRIVGQTSSQGVKIKKIAPHALDRVGERLISVGRVEKLLASEDVRPDKKHADRKVYHHKGCNLVLSDSGDIITVFWGGK